MSWNQQPQQQQRSSQQPVDPWASSFTSTPAPSNSGWPSTTTSQTSGGGGYPSSSTQGGYPSSTQQWGAPSYPGAAPQWPNTSSTSTSSAWNQPQPAPAASSAWPSATTQAAPAWGAPAASQPARPAPQPAWGQPAAAPSAATPSWQSAAPQPAPISSSAWPSSAPQWPDTSSAWATTSATLNTSTSQPWGANASFSGSQPSRPTPQPQVANPFSYNDPFSTSTSMHQPMNTSYSNVNNASFQSAGSFNPFDVTNDDAGFFAAKPAASTAQANRSLQKQSSSTARDIPAPSATTQRLMRVASMLFERGLIIKADKMLIQEMVLRGDKHAEKALENAERDGSLQDLHSAILKERKREANGGSGSESDDDEDNRAEAAAASFKKRPSIRKNSDDDDDQTDALDVSRRQSLAVGKDGAQAPHPAAGGYTGNVPPEMGIQKGQFVGTILMRISSKKMFRKWKPVFFALDLPRVTIFDNRREWEMGAAPKFVIPLHECMWIAKPTLKKTYSLIDDGRRVYYSTLKENSPSVVGQAAMSGMERPTAFSPALEARVVAKFGSYYPDEISAFAHAIYSVVLVHQKEVKASLAKSGGTSRRAASGFGS